MLRFFVGEQVDIPLAELEEHKTHVQSLCYPLDTVMDLSIGMLPELASLIVTCGTCVCSSRPCESFSLHGGRSEDAISPNLIAGTLAHESTTATAMWFAARGKGRLCTYGGGDEPVVRSESAADSSHPSWDQTYLTPARVMLVGIGMQRPSATHTETSPWLNPVVK